MELHEYSFSIFFMRTDRQTNRGTEKFQQTLHKDGNLLRKETENRWTKELNHYFVL